MGDSQDKEITDFRAQIAALQEENFILQEKVKLLTFNMMMSYNIVQISFYKEIHTAFKWFHNHISGPVIVECFYPMCGPTSRGKGRLSISSCLSQKDKT